MPSPRYIPAPDTGNAIGDTLKAFIEGGQQNMEKQRESDALKQIYQQYQDDGKNLEKAFFDVQSNKNIGPTAKVNTAKQLMEFRKYNEEGQKALKEQTTKVDQVRDIEKRYDLPVGSLKAHESNPSMALQVAKGEHGTEGNRAIGEDQRKVIREVTSSDEFQNADPADQTLMLLDKGVSRANTDAVMKPRVEANKVDVERQKVLNKKEAESDAKFAEEMSAKYPILMARKETLQEAKKLNEENVTGNTKDLAMQKLGLLQYTSEGFRKYASYAKDMVKNANIKSIIGSQISQMEFNFFRDATISERFSKEANRQIIKKEEIANRYETLYYDIANNIVEENEGQIPQGFQRKVNKEFEKQSKKLSDELKTVARDYKAIQEVPKGMVLMYDKNRNPLHVPENEVKKATQSGASLQ